MNNEQINITLSIDEIKDIAQFAGLQVADVSDGDDMESEITITCCPQQGIKNDDGSIIYSRHVAYFDEYPEEGMMPLGKIVPIEQMPFGHQSIDAIAKIEPPAENPLDKSMPPSK